MALYVVELGCPGKQYEIGLQRNEIKYTIRLMLKVHFDTVA